MKGIDTQDLYDKFADAVSGFPPTARPGKKAEQVFMHSYLLLNDLAKAKIPRAMGWKAYALALSVYEGWPLPPSVEEERAWLPATRLEKAEAMALEATKADPYDYDVFWALADVYLIRKNFTKAVETFQVAMDLNRHERHPNLLAEAAAAQMHDGDHDQSSANFARARRRPDWHRWMNGILLVMRSGRENEDQGSLLDEALAELKGTHTTTPGQDYYQEEIQLILAVAHWKKHKLSEAEGEATEDPIFRTTMELSSQAHKREAEQAIRQFRRTFKDWTEDQVKTALPFREPEDTDYLMKTVAELWKVKL
jgi:tetratricopeptide (TPR) repeat protein